MAKMKGDFRPEVQNRGVNIDRIEKRDFDQQVEEALKELEDEPDRHTGPHC